MAPPTEQAHAVESAGGWLVQHRHGSADELHGDPDVTRGRRLVLVNDVTRAALVLGSTQAETDVDRRLSLARGIDVVRRRSGGGAVLLVPGEHVWVDLVLPADDPWWTDDVTAASVRVGERWAAAIDEAGAGPCRVHTGGVRGGAAARVACFAGTGPGEVMRGGIKLVGVAQRRTREWARFQCIVHRRWDAAGTLDLLRSRPAGLEQALQHRVGSLAAGPGADWDVVGALLEHLR